MGTILVVEDDVNDREIVRRAFRRRGLEYESACRFVADGAAAIAYLSGKSPYEDRVRNPFPDIILLDLGLPTVNGLGVLDWMRRTAGCENVKVVVWSGWVYEKHVKEAMQAGASLFVKKDVGGKDILEVVAVITGQRLPYPADEAALA